MVEDAKMGTVPFQAFQSFSKLFKAIEEQLESERAARELQRALLRSM